MVKKILVRFYAPQWCSSQLSFILRIGYNCGPGPQVWSAVYPLVGPQVRKSEGPHFTRALRHPQIRNPLFTHGR